MCRERKSEPERNAFHIPINHDIRDQHFKHEARRIIDASNI